MPQLRNLYNGNTDNWITVSISLIAVRSNVYIKHIEQASHGVNITRHVYLYKGDKAGWVSGCMDGWMEELLGEHVRGLKVDGMPLRPGLLLLLLSRCSRVRLCATA